MVYYKRKGDVMSDIFDFEQQILKCWNITDDLKEAN
jgi:hypothetical protein